MKYIIALGTKTLIEECTLPLGPAFTEYHGDHNYGLPGQPKTANKQQAETDRNFAFVTVYPSYIEARIESGSLDTQPLTNLPKGYTRNASIGQLFATLLSRGVEHIQVRYENADD